LRETIRAVSVTEIIASRSTFKIAMVLLVEEVEIAFAYNIHASFFGFKLSIGESKTLITALEIAVSIVAGCCSFSFRFFNSSLIDHLHFVLWKRIDLGNININKC